MQPSLKPDRIRQLFQAYKVSDDVAFMRTAKGIIAEELAANHHTFATDLQRAIGPGRDKSASAPPTLAVVPRERRGDEDLLYVDQTDFKKSEPILGKSTQQKLDRLLEEHRRVGHLAKYGLRPKNRLLFWGPPGCGKTLTAGYVASHLGLPLAVLRLSSVISSYVGDTASNLQRVFDKANRTPLVLLLDEVDALGKNRDDPNDVGELKRVVNSLLQALDAFKNPQSVLIAASNHQYLLDPALWRRFEDIVEFPIPDNGTRIKYLAHLLSGVKFKGSLAAISKGMNGLSFADIERISLEAVKTMILRDRETMTTGDVQVELQTWKLAVGSARTRTGARRK